MNDDQPIQKANPGRFRHLVTSAWFAPASLALLFIGLMGGLIWLMQTRALRADQAGLARSLHTEQESLQRRLHATHDYLVTMAEDMARETITQELFSNRLTHYMNEHPELVSAMYVDAEGKARWVVPPQWEKDVLGLPLACPRSLEVCQEARRTLEPVYSEVHISIQNEPAFDLAIPIHEGNRFLGAIVGVYSCERMLHHMLNAETAQEYRASLVDARGNRIVALPATARLDERLSASTPLQPPGEGLFLQLDNYGHGFWGLGVALLVVLCVSLAVGMSWGMWSLKRQIARRADAERMLQEAHDRLAQRVSERTADLEATNQQLQREIAERQRAEEDARQHQEQLAHVARVSVMGEMATGLAHELNQPLGAIATFAEGGLRLMESGTATPEALHTALTEVSGQAQRAGTIIQRLRSFVAMGEPKRELHQLKPLFEELVELVAAELRQKQIRFQLRTPQPLPPVLVDGILIQQVLLNLIRNAMDALQQVDPGRRRIDVTAAAMDDSTIMVSVSDSGPGCPPESIDKMFEAFFTTKTSGIGMGLPISRSIVEAHGGRICATANPAGGLTILFTVPTANGEHDAAVQEA